MPFVPLIETAKCRPDAGTFVEHAGRELAVFLMGKPPGVEVIDNACPHAGGNLAGGEVKNGIVTCRWHQWEFDLRTGRCTHSDRARVKHYPAEIRDGVVWADLSSPG